MDRKRNLNQDLDDLAHLEPDAAAALRSVERTRGVLFFVASTIVIANTCSSTHSLGNPTHAPRNLAALAAAALILIFATQWLPSNSGSSFAFAQVQEQVAKTKSVQFDQSTTYQMPYGKSLPSQVDHVMILGDHLKRSETKMADPDADDSSLGPWGPSANVYDLKKKKWAIFYPEIKGYLVSDWHGTFAEGYVDPEEDKKSADKQAWDATPLPTEGKAQAASADKSHYAGDTKVVTSPDGSDEKISPNTFRGNGDFHPNANFDLKEEVNAKVVPQANKPDEAKPASVESKSADSNVKKGGGENHAPTGDWTYSEYAPDMSAMKPMPQLDIYELVRHVPTDKATRLPEKQIDRRKVVGFLVEQKEHRGGADINWQHTWWVDPSTKLPLQLEIVEHNSKEPAKEAKSLVKNIVFDATLDPAKFSVDPPAGYFDINAELKKAEPRLMAYVQKAQKPGFMNSMRFVETETAKTKDGRQLPQIMKRVTILDNRLKREEVTIDSANQSEKNQIFAGIEPHISIQDAKQNKSLVLLSDKKEYLDPTKTSFTPDYLRWARKHGPVDAVGKLSVHDVFRYAGEKVKRLPLKMIDGRLVYGEVTEESKQGGGHTEVFTRTCWIDPIDNQFVLVEGSLRSTDPNTPDVDWMARDFEIGNPVDRALFSTEPPKDYKQISDANRRDHAIANSDSSEKHFEFVFADVQDEVAKLKTVQFTTISNRTIGKNHVPEAIIKTTIIGPYLKREELTLKDPDKLEDSRRWGIVPNTTVHNVKTGEYLVLMPDTKTFAGPTNFGYVAPKDAPPDKKQIEAAKARTDAWLKDPQVDFYEEIRRFPEKKATKLAEKMIGDKHVVGFQIEQRQQDKSRDFIAKTTYWIDTATKLPVQIEHRREDSSEFGLGFDTVIRDFVFDVPIDESLFSFVPPKNYTEMGKTVAADSSSKAAGPENKKTEFVFADVQEEVAKTKSVQYTELRTDGTKNGDYFSQTKTDVKILGAAKERRELTKKIEKQPPGTLLMGDEHYIQVRNAATGKLICLWPDKKEYDVPQVVLSVGDDLQVSASKIDHKPNPKADFYARISELPADPVQQLPEQTIDGKQAIGFVFEDKHESPYGIDIFKRTCWVDPSTKLPIRIEVAFRTTNPTKGESDWVSNDFIFDAPLDESLFSTDPPSGYVDQLKKAYGADGVEFDDKHAKKMEQLFTSLEDQLHKASTLQYAMTIHRKSVSVASNTAPRPSENKAEVERPTESTSTNRVVLSGPDLAREEHSSDLANEKYSKVDPDWNQRNYVHIVNSTDGKEIYLYPDAKAYRVKKRAAQSNKSPKATSDSNARSEQLLGLQGLFMIPTQFVRQLPPEVIDRKNVDVFVLQSKGDNFLNKQTFWVDPETKRLIKAEEHNRSQTTTVGENNPSGGKPENSVNDHETTALRHDFIFDAPLEKSLFDTTPPPDWTNLDAKSGK